MYLRNMKNNSKGRSSFNRKKKVTLSSNPYIKIKVTVGFKFAHKHSLMFSSLLRVSIHALGFSLPFCSCPTLEVDLVVWLLLSPLATQQAKKLRNEMLEQGIVGVFFLNTRL